MATNVNDGQVMYTEQNLDNRGGATGAGVRKVSERVVQKGRGLIITDENINNYSWDDIPAGSLLVNPKTGTVQVKLEGASNWQPGLIKNDGTICISQDSAVIVERFRVINPLLDDKTFTYEDITEPGKIISGKIAVTSDGYQKYTGYTFTLTHGEYMEDRNHLEVTIVRNMGTENETTILCDVVNGSLMEDDFNRFTLVNQHIQSGDQIVARYFRIVRIGNPYPRWFVTDRKPDTLTDGIQKSEEGDMWLDYTETVDETSNAWIAERSDMLGWGRYFKEDENGYRQMPNLQVEWRNIQHKPMTFRELGLEDELLQTIDRAITNDIKYENIHFVSHDGKTTLDELSRKSTPALPSIDWYNISNRPEPVRVLETLSSAMVNGRFNTKEEIVELMPNSSETIDWPCPVKNHPRAYIISQEKDTPLYGTYVEARDYGIRMGYDNAINKVVLVNTTEEKINVHLCGTAEGIVS